MNIVIKEAEEKHVILCVNILQNTELGTVYFSDYKKTVDFVDVVEEDLSSERKKY